MRVRNFSRLVLTIAGAWLCVLLPNASRGTGSAGVIRALPAIAPVRPCAALKTADLSGTVDRPVHVRAADESTQVAAHPYCKVEGVIEPAVRFEVHLPLKGWTQRYLQIGCGGLCGTVNVRLDDHARNCLPAENGELALASTDMGHEGGMDGAWAANNPQARIDFAYRGVHVTAVVAKALIAHFYGQAPRFSYFSGCSDGGREALVEAQRYPQDFNGIAAGAPALNFSVQNSFYHAWNALSNIGPNSTAILTAEKLPILHAAALEACDAADGLKDGLIDDPRRCHFNPGLAQCHPNQEPSHCLTAAEVEVARRIYAGAHDAKGRKLVIGGPMPGSELAWAGVSVPNGPNDRIFSAAIAEGSVRNLYYSEPLPPSWTLKDLKFDQATLDSFTYREIYDATNPDLARFAAAGGRLLLWHGWSDPHISPLNSIAYYAAVQKLMSADEVGRFMRLFLMPGMFHCNGGDGPFAFDVLTPLMAWVENGDAPERLFVVHEPQSIQPGAMPQPVAVPQRAAIDRTRPVFAFPKVARYRGTGSIDDAANFVAVDPSGPRLPPIEWLGTKYMAPRLQKVCEATGHSMTCKPAP